MEVGDDHIFVSSITIAELYFGAFNSSEVEQNCEMLDQLVGELNVVQLDNKAGRVFGAIKANLKKTGQIIGDSDLFISATAISRKMILVTNNERHFKRIGELGLANWTKL